MTEKTEPCSLCLCGHTGDGPGSQHWDSLSEGHGSCKQCDCAKFTWLGFLPYGEGLVKKSRKKRKR